ncbi:MULTISPECIES: tyrosinase family protein [unclassified Pseudomonas]|uniref:tyrosinase family protein n=1 Tax=unclassified Pseudomonas TaxID=196821 RepID=UPI000CD1E1ED|nr:MULTISPECIES: tyrosinase family protein [unclassified Pseudomonas]POA25704.1 tyrosinase [Pseudomonas sp. GW456-R21]POA64672.1 tyrosinase [Pseudomonas sp. GW460-R15]
MIVRKNVRSLSPNERADFINSVLTLKRRGGYDKYVHWHHAVMVPTVHSYEPRDPTYRNGAHLGPSFLPWHREMLMQFEADLHAIDPNVALPYWDWTEDANDPENSPIWADDFMGGNGDSTDHWRVARGAFAHQYGNWPVPAYPEDNLPEPGLKRQFGLLVASLPTSADVGVAMRERLYDTPPYNSGPYTRGFRNRLEGWVTQRGDPQVTTPGSQLHNRVHLWIGGNMLAMTSPEDPVFFLHHCFVDKVWADWQAEMAKYNGEWAPHYAPMENGPPGHNYEDVLKPWQRKISEVMDITVLGYRYEQSTSALVMPERAFKSPFEA